MNERFTILIIYAWDNFWAMGEGAGASSFFDSAHAYIDHGHDVHVLLPDLGREGHPKTYHEMRLTPVPFAADPLELRKGPLGFLTKLWRYRQFVSRMTKAGARLAKEIKPHAVVAMGPHSAPVAYRIARSHHIPNATRLFGQALSLHMDRDGRVRDRLRFYADFPEVLAFRTPCDALIVHNDGSRGDVVARHFNIPAERFHFWRDGIDFSICEDRDLPADTRAQFGCRPDSIVGVSIGRLSPEKNVDRILDSLATIEAATPNLDFVFVGDGPWKDFLEQRTREKHLRRVHFAGAMPREELYRIFGIADFAVSVSQRTNMMNSVIESMAAGIPFLALNTGDTQSVVQHEETGLLVEPDQLERLPIEMQRMVDDDALRERLGQNARDFIRREFESKEVRLKREVDVVQEAIRKSRNK